jgi:hypothetical protein
VNRHSITPAIKQNNNDAGALPAAPQLGKASSAPDILLLQS